MRCWSIFSVKAPLWRLALLLTVLVWQPATAESALQSLNFSGRPLHEVLALYEAAGFELVYSRALTRGRAIFQQEPEGKNPIERLQSALQSYDLALEQGTSGAWLLVRTPSAQPPPNIDPVEVELDVPPLEELVVVSSRYRIANETTTSVRRIDQNTLNQRPELGDDALRVANALPGSASLGLSAKPHIRGGLQDELLVRYNNIELLEPFHLRDFQSVFSGLNPSLIESVDLYTGGFPARYGNRMGAVMDIQPAEPDGALSGELLLSLLTTSAALQGNRDNGGTWALSARRGNLDWVTQQVNDSVGRPSYADWTGQFRHPLTANTELDLGFIGYNDNISLQDFDSDGEIARSNYRNLYGWMQLRSQISERLDTTIALSAGRIRHKREGFLLDEDLDNGEANLLDERSFELWRLQQQWRYAPGPNLTIEFGGNLQYQTGKYDFAASIERGVLAEFLGLPLSLTRNVRLRPKGLSTGLYSSMRWRARTWLAIEAGLRWDAQDYGEQDTANGGDRGTRHQLSPRLSLRVDLNEVTRLRVSAGRFQQPEGIHELGVSDGLTRYQRTQHADHYIVGMERAFADNTFTARVEVFHKRFDNVKVRFENLFNPLVLLPELASDRVRIAPTKARASGYEVSFAYDPSERHSAWLSVGESKAEDRIDNRWRARTWDQGITWNAGTYWTNGAWSLSLAWQRHQGWRTTALPDFVLPDTQPALQVRSQRLPAYASWNLRVAKSWERPRQSLSLYLEVTNLRNRDNVGGIEYELEEAEDGPEGFVVEPTKETLLPLVPSIGLIWRF